MAYYIGSFIMDGLPQFQAQHTVDAKSLLDNLAIDSTWYLLGVQLGNEIVDGSGKIEISRIDANVNGKDAQRESCTDIGLSGRLNGKSGTN